MVEGTTPHLCKLFFPCIPSLLEQRKELCPVPGNSSQIIQVFSECIFAQQGYCHSIKLTWESSPGFCHIHIKLPNRPDIIALFPEMVRIWGCERISAVHIELIVKGKFNLVCVVSMNEEEGLGINTQVGEVS